MPTGKAVSLAQPFRETGDRRDASLPLLDLLLIRERRDEERRILTDYLPKTTLRGLDLPKTNYSYAKRQRELAKKQKKEEKRRRKDQLSDESNADAESETTDGETPTPAPKP